MSNNSKMVVALFVYTLVWWWLTGIFGVIASYGFYKALMPYVENGVELRGGVYWEAFLDSKAYWISSFLIAFGIGFVAGLMMA